MLIIWIKSVEEAQVIGLLESPSPRVVDTTKSKCRGKVKKKKARIYEYYSHLGSWHMRFRSWYVQTPYAHARNICMI